MEAQRDVADDYWVTQGDISGWMKMNRLIDGLRGRRNQDQADRVCESCGCILPANRFGPQWAQTKKLVKALLCCFMASVWCDLAVRAQEPSSTPDVQSAAEVPKGYEIGEESVSPDGRFAILYPVQEESYANLPPNLLVRLKPYSVLAKLGDEEGRPEGARDEPKAMWSGNSVAAIWIARKWGMDALAIYEIENDKVKRVQPVWREVRKYFERDFRQRFLKKYPKENDGFHFVSDVNEALGVQALEFKGRKLSVNLFADNSPNLASGPHWTAEFHAVWNVDTAKFEEVDFRPGEIEVRGEPEG